MQRILVRGVQIALFVFLTVWFHEAAPETSMLAASVVAMASVVVLTATALFLKHVLLWLMGKRGIYD